MTLELRKVGGELWVNPDEVVSVDSHHDWSVDNPHTRIRFTSGAESVVPGAAEDVARILTEERHEIHSWGHPEPLRRSPAEIALDITRDH